MRFSASIRRTILVSAAMAAIASAAYAQQVSPPVTLQWFESPWKTIERRTPDLFAAGYGSLWTPPPGRAVYLPEGGGIGYDPYDRFDLGKPRDPTLYGTEGSYKSAIASVRRMGGNVYVDYVHHHLGSLDMDFNGNTYPPNVANQGGAFPHFGNQVPYLRHHADYPGFEVTTPGVFKNSGSSYRDTYSEVGGPSQSDPEWQYWYRLRGATGSGNLITLDLANNRMLVRNPVPGNAQNVPQSSTSWQFPTTTIGADGKVGPDLKFRQANTPDAGNARFYPDLQGPSRVVRDNGVNYTVYDFNSANPFAGDPVAETSLGYMMRYAQWMTQAVGVDGLRIDAARHVPLGQFNSFWNPNSLDVPKLIDRATAGASSRLNLDGTRRNVFQFQEIFSYDPNFLKTFIRKSQPSGDTVNPNRDVLDFSMWEAMAKNMGSNGAANDWFSIRSASVNAAVYNTLDPNIANNGDNGIGFVYNHDEGIAPPGSGGSITLDNVAHAWILMRPGNAYAFYRGNEFDRTGNTRFFLKNGRGDALGGQYGSIITTLLDVRNSYGRGNFIERFIDNAGPNNEKLANSAIYVFERQGAAVVGLNIGYNPGVATRNVQTSFVPGTRLEEVTGNWQDPSGQVPRTVTVDGTGKVNISIPWNNANNGNKGYVVYGLPRPRGSMVISNVSQVLTDPAPTPATNGTARINSIDVITANTFTLTLNTSAVTLSDGFRDTYADGDRALFKIDDGFDANGNGTFDNASSSASNATKYGFESFSFNDPGFDANPANSGSGTYSQVINAANLGEGYHYITSRAWRKQGVQESEVYTDFRRTIYVDRLAPISEVDSTGQMPYQSNDRSRDIRVKSTDGTADNMHIFFDLPAALSEADILNLVAGGTGQGTWLDSGLFGKEYTNVGSGNHVVTAVTYEVTGNKSIQRFVGRYIGTSRGAGLGDTNYDGGYTTSDVTNFEDVLYSQDTQFNAASDLTADGRVNNLDLFALPGRYASVMSSSAFAEANAAIVRRGNLNGDGATNSIDIDVLGSKFGQTSNTWLYDLNVDNAVNSADLDILVRNMLGTEYGDANLDRRVNTIDFNLLAGNFGMTSGATWAMGDFTANGAINSLDFNALVAQYGFIGSVSSGPAGLGSLVPEPGSMSVLLLVGVAGLRRRR